MRFFFFFAKLYFIAYLYSLKPTKENRWKNLAVLIENVKNSKIYEDRLIVFSEQFTVFIPVIISQRIIYWYYIFQHVVPIYTWLLKTVKDLETHCRICSKVLRYGMTHQTYYKVFAKVQSFLDLKINNVYLFMYIYIYGLTCVCILNYRINEKNIINVVHA